MRKTHVRQVGGKFNLGRRSLSALALLILGYYLYRLRLAL